MGIQIEKARPEQYDEVVDFATMVFSVADGDGTYFPNLLPKLYSEKNGPETMPFHYLLREDGAIKACVLSYPMELWVCGTALRAWGIGTVSVHPRSRGKSYMRQLMWEAIRDMEEQGADFSVLGGLRQRYGYYGYEKTGSTIKFSVNKANVRHACYDVDLSGVTMEQVKPEDREALDWIAACNERRPLHVARPRAMVHDILSSWSSRIFFFREGGKPLGYLSANGPQVQEIDTGDSQKAFWKVLCKYISCGNEWETKIEVGPDRTEQIAWLRWVAEYFTLSSGENVKVFCFERVIEAFLRLKGSQYTLPDGELRINIRDYGVVEIAVRDGVATARKLAEGSGAHLELARAEAQMLLTEPISLYDGVLEQLPREVREWFPLPFAFPKADNV